MSHAVATAETAESVRLGPTGGAAPGGGGDYPRSKGNPIVGDTVAFGKQPLQFILQLPKQLGDVAGFSVAFKDWVLIAHPDDVYEAVVRRADIFYKPKINRDIFKQFLGFGILSADGDYYKKQHKLIFPAFHHKRINAYSDVVVGYATELVKNEWKPGETRDICADMTGLTLAVIGKTLFDADVKGDASIVGDAMHVINEALAAHAQLPLPLPRWWPSATNGN